jgi:hypothetical protein
MMMNKERLLKLASELERCSDGRVLKIPRDGTAFFDMGTVVAAIEPEFREDYHGCGTAACAMGFAGLHPWFQERGLEWSPRLRYLKVNNRSHTFNRAAQTFFGVTYDDAEDLFNPTKYVNETPKQVAKRIRAFVAEHA